MIVETNFIKQASFINLPNLEYGTGAMKRTLPEDIQNDSAAILLSSVNELVVEILGNIENFSELAKFRAVSTNWRSIIDAQIWPARCEKMKIEHEKSNLTAKQKVDHFANTKCQPTHAFAIKTVNSNPQLYNLHPQSPLTYELFNLINIDRITELNTLPKACKEKESLIFRYSLESSIDKNSKVIRAEDKYCIDKLFKLSSSNWHEENKTKLMEIQNLFLHKEFNSIPSDIKYLTNLAQLSVRNSKISELIPEIFQLTNLRHLNLTSNRISVIPSEIGNLINLESLSLSNNRISFLPPEIDQLRNLKHLNLTGNPLNNNMEIDIPNRSI